LYTNNIFRPNNKLYNRKIIIVEYYNEIKYEIYYDIGLGKRPIAQPHTYAAEHGRQTDM